MSCLHAVLLVFDEQWQESLQELSCAGLMCIYIRYHADLTATYAVADIFHVKLSLQVT